MVNQFIVVESKLVEQGGLIVVGSDFVDGGAMADFVSFAIDCARIESTAGKPGTEALSIMVASGFGARLHNRQPANLTTPMDDGTIQ